MEKPSSFSQQLPWTLIINKSVENESIYVNPITPKESNWIPDVGKQYKEAPDQNDENHSSESRSQIETETDIDTILVLNESESYIKADNKKISLSFKFYSKYKCNYKLLLYVNHYLIGIDGNKYNRIEAQEMQSYEWDEIIPLEQSKDCFVYAVLIPEDNEQAILVKTETKMITF